jgi:phage baseplate assembly protein W
MSTEVDPTKAFLGVGWSFPIKPDRDLQDMASAEYAEDIRQAILIILETTPGERVMRPDFGCGLMDMVFEPASYATEARIQRIVEAALIQWEPRIDVQEVKTKLKPVDRNTIDITIIYQIRATNTFYNLVYPFYLQEVRE